VNNANPKPEQAKSLALELIGSFVYTSLGQSAKIRQGIKMILRCPNCDRKLECVIEAGVECTLDCPACNEPFTITGEEATQLSSKQQGIKFQKGSFEDDIDRTSMTIAEYMAEKGMKGGVDLDGDVSSTNLKSSLIIGEHGKKYEIKDIAGQGGMGVVHIAKDVNIKRKIAMKVIIGDGKDINDEQLLRFISEAQVTGQLEHPSIVPVHELGIDADNNIFYTMKLINGVTLKEIIKQIKAGHQKTIRSYPLSSLMNIFIKVCEGMAFAHSKGVIHRDLKPENIMIGEFGEVVILDWGLVKVLDTDEDDSAIEHARKVIKQGDKKAFTKVGSSRTIDVHQTMEGAAMGTPSFMAPEQAYGKIDALGSRTDIYALGGILYNILSLRCAVHGKHVNAILLNIVSGKLDPLIRKGAKLPHIPNGIPQGLAAVTSKAMALLPEDRYETAAEIKSDIEAWQSGFATGAEDAGIGTQLKLLIKRNKKLVITSLTLALAALFLITGITWYSFKQIKERESIAIIAKEEALKAEKEAIKAHENTRIISRKASPKFVDEAERFLISWKMDDAWEAALTATELDPKNAKAWYVRGRASLMKQNLKEARQAFEQCSKYSLSDESLKKAK